MRPELPYIGAGAVVIIGATMREKRWPKEANGAIIGIVVLTLFASATTGTRIAPLAHAIGLLLLLTALMAAVKQHQKGK